MIQIHRLQEKEMEGGEGKFHYLVALKGSIAWWPLEGGGEAHFHLFPLSLNKIHLNLHFFH